MNIFEAAEGFLPSAFIVANPSRAITADGPATTTNMTSNIIRVFMYYSSRSTSMVQSFLKSLTIPFFIGM
jgi:hypothetical protein